MANQKKDVKDILHELEHLASEVKNKSQKNKRKTKSKTSLHEEQLKDDLNKVKEIKKSLDVLEHEVFIKIDNPDKIVGDLIQGKNLVKDITTTLMALTKINKLKEEIMQKLERDINELKKISMNMEKALNLEQYGKSVSREFSPEVINKYIDTIEDDIEEIKRYIGIAK